MEEDRRVVNAGRQQPRQQPRERLRKTSTRLLVLSGIIVLVLTFGYYFDEVNFALGLPRPAINLPNAQATAQRDIVEQTTPLKMGESPTAKEEPPYPPPPIPTAQSFHPSDTSVPYIEITAVPVEPIATRAPKPPLPLDSAEAIEWAIAVAHERGLQQPRPDKVAIQQMALGEYYKLVGVELGTDAAKFGLDPNQLVWVVAMKGKVKWSAPGQVGDQSDNYDNITIVLNVETGDVIATLAAGPGQPLPIAIP